MPLNEIVTTVTQLSKIISDIQKIRGITNFMGNGLTFEMYRGQGNEDWNLEPNLSRKIKDPLELKRIEKEMTTEFHDALVTSGRSKRIQTGFLNGQYHGDWLLLQQAQHYELPTRFMDWTTKWKVALYFAVANSNHDNVNGEFWVYKVPSEKLLIDNEQSVYRNEDPFSYSETMFLNSASLSSPDYLTQLGMKRKDKQQGRFLIQAYSEVLIPLQENPVHKKNLTKFIIPAASKASIRNELETKGLTKESLYIEKDSFIEDLNSRLKAKYGV